jgi:hypothetical protein
MRGSSDLSQGSAETVYLLSHIIMDTNIIRRDAEIRNLLEQKAEQNDITGAVAREALSYCDAGTFLSELLTYGCVSGMV